MRIPEEVTDRVPSPAVRVWVPAVFRVAEKVPTPPVRVADPGRMALPSFELMLTFPEYPVAIFPEASSAVTLNEMPSPAIFSDGIDARESRDALEGLT